jgi:hypothetical protein
MAIARRRRGRIATRVIRCARSIVIPPERVIGRPDPGTCPTRLDSGCSRSVGDPGVESLAGPVVAAGRAAAGSGSIVTWEAVRGKSSGCRHRTAVQVFWPNSTLGGDRPTRSVRISRPAELTSTNHRYPSGVILCTRQSEGLRRT